MKSLRAPRSVFGKPSVRRFLCTLAWLTLLAADASRLRAQELGEIAGAKQICEAGPAARLARAERLSGAAQVVAADVLPNPSLVAEHQRSLSGATEHETILGVSLPLSIGGRRSLLQDAARARQEQAAFAASNTLRCAIWYDKFNYFRRTRSVTQKHECDLIDGGSNNEANQ